MVSHSKPATPPGTDNEIKGEEPVTPETEATAQQDEPAEPADDTVARLTGEVADLRDRLLRAIADNENMRRRTEREVADARSYAIAKFAGDMLEVADNMDRALSNVPKGSASADDPTVKALTEGAELTQREMLRALEKHGVRKIDPLGERFDPHFHQAIVKIPDPKVPNDTVVQVMQVGYTIGSRLLRAAMVGVSSGGPKAEAPATEKAG